MRILTQELHTEIRVPAVPEKHRSVLQAAELSAKTVASKAGL